VEINPQFVQALATLAQRLFHARAVEESIAASLKALEQMPGLRGGPQQPGPGIYGKGQFPEGDQTRGPGPAVRLPGGPEVSGRTGTLSEKLPKEIPVWFPPRSLSGLLFLGKVSLKDLDPETAIPLERPGGKKKLCFSRS